MDKKSVDKNRCVIRLLTSTWSDKKGLHLKRSLIFLRRKCIGYNVLEEESSDIGIDKVICSITNLDQCEDGIYEVITHNIKYDYETGYADDWDYKLIPFIQE